METTVLKFKKLDTLASIPQRAHPTDSGMDIRSVEAHTLGHLERHTFSTGLAAIIPEGYELQVRPRSGLASKGIVAMFGTVDEGYRGEISITLVNLGNDTHTVSIGDKIAQLVLAPVVRPEIEETDDVRPSETDRGIDGFGSTGVGA